MKYSLTIWDYIALCFCLEKCFIALVFFIVLSFTIVVESQKQKFEEVVVDWILYLEFGLLFCFGLFIHANSNFSKLHFLQ